MKNLVAPLFFAKNKTNARSYIRDMIKHIKKSHHIDSVDKINLDVKYPIIIKPTLYSSQISYNYGYSNQLIFQKIKITKKIMNNMMGVIK